MRASLSSSHRLGDFSWVATLRPSVPTITRQSRSCSGLGGLQPGCPGSPGSLPPVGSVCKGDMGLCRVLLASLCHCAQSADPISPPRSALQGSETLSVPQPSHTGLTCKPSETSRAVSPTPSSPLLGPSGITLPQTLSVVFPWVIESVLGCRGCVLARCPQGLTQRDFTSLVKA